MAWCSSYCGLVDDPFFIRTTAKHTARVRKWRACSDVGMSARTGDSVKTVVPKFFMANTRIELDLGGANRHQSSVGNVSDLASCQVGGRIGPLWQIKQAP